MSDETQALCFLAGANSIFYGDKLLTTENPAEHHDRGLFEQLGIRAGGAYARRRRPADRRPMRRLSGLTTVTLQVPDPRTTSSSSIRAPCGARSTVPAAPTMRPQPCRRKSARACSSGSTSCASIRQPSSTSAPGPATQAASCKRRYPSAQVIALDSSLPMLRQSARQQRLLRRFVPVVRRCAPPAAAKRLVRPGAQQPAARVVPRSRRGVRRGRARAAAEGTVHVHDARPGHIERSARALARTSTPARMCIVSSTCTTSATRCCGRGSPSR